VFQLSDALWGKIEPILPKVKRRKKSLGGRPRIPDRVVLNGILYVLRTGSQWAALDATGICKHTTAHSRFQEWCRRGVFCKIWKAALEEYDDCEGIDWRWQSMDGAMTKAPLGGGKDRAQPHGSRQKRGETQSAHRRRGNPHRPRSGRREPQ
jgi:putative transposase